VSGGKPVDLPTILDRVDSRQRLVPTFEELADGLRRAGAAGRIRQVAPGRYVDARRTTDGGAVSDLTLAEYTASVRAYHEGFTADLLRISPFLNWSTRVLEGAYKVTGGRFGLEPGMVDMDGVALAFVLDLDLQTIGWSCEVAHRIDGVRRIEVAPTDAAEAVPGKPADRAEVVAIVTKVIHQDARFKGPHRLVFPDGQEFDLAPP
jgi:hypothetical protein